MRVQLSWTALVAAALASAFASTARSQCKYDVSTFWLPGAGAMYVNDRRPDGRLVGSYVLAGAGFGKAFRRLADGTLQALPPTTGVFESAAHAIAEDGTIAGFVHLTQQKQRPCLWINGVWTQLPSPDNASECHADGVNSSGVAVGMWRHPDSTPYPVMWVDGKFIDLTKTLGVEYGFCDAVTEDGWIYGNAAFPPFEGLNVFRWNIATGELGIFDGIYGPASASEDKAVASNGFVSGITFTNPSIDLQGFFIDHDAMIGLGAPDYCNRSYAEGVNALGAVTGVAEGCGARQSSISFLWMNGQFSFVRDLLVSPFIATVSTVSLICDDGVIVANGKDSNGQNAVLLLKPIRTRPGDVTIDCKVDQHDLDALFEFWGKQYSYDNGPGDLNGDHTVDAQDLALVLGDWGP